MEKDFEMRLNEAISKTTADQAMKEKALMENAEQANAKALEEIKLQNERALKAKLEAAEESK